MVEKGLENLGIQVIAASLAMDGLRLVETEQPDAALVDVCLPEMNGFELFRKIRALDSKIPMIFVTSVVKPPLKPCDWGLLTISQNPLISTNSAR